MLIMFPRFTGEQRAQAAIMDFQEGLPFAKTILWTHEAELLVAYPSGRLDRGLVVIQ